MMQLKKLAILAGFACIGYSSKLSAQTTPTDSLVMYRQQIDSLDKQLIAILGKRMQVVDEVGKYKALHSIPALQQSRFDALLQKNIALGQAVNLSSTLVTEVMNAIHKESLSKEHAVGAPEKTE